MNSSVQGALFVPALAATVSLVGKRAAVVATVDGSVVTNTGDIVGGAVGAVAGFAFKLDDRVTIGFSGHVAQSKFSSTIGVGSRGGGVPVDVPTVRVLLTNEWSVERWAFADYALSSTYVGPRDAGAVASATYRFGY